MLHALKLKVKIISKPFDVEEALTRVRNMLETACSMRAPATRRLEIPAQQDPPDRARQPATSDHANFGCIGERSTQQECYGLVYLDLMINKSTTL